MASNFWHNPGVEPKRNFRFEISIGGPAPAGGLAAALAGANTKVSELTWLAKTVERPKATVSSIEHKYLNHTFNYPGRVVWNPVAITLVDPVSPVDTSAELYRFVELAGYQPPVNSGPNGANASLAAASSALLKDKSTVGSIGTVHIRMLSDDAGAIPTGDGRYSDQWTLHNAFVDGEINWGSLDYTSEELLTVSFTLKYDWATFLSKNGTGLGPLKPR